MVYYNQIFVSERETQLVQSAKQSLKFFATEITTVGLKHPFMCMNILSSHGWALYVLLWCTYVLYILCLGW